MEGPSETTISQNAKEIDFPLIPLVYRQTVNKRRLDQTGDPSQSQFKKRVSKDFSEVYLKIGVVYEKKDNKERLLIVFVRKKIKNICPLKKVTKLAVDKPREKRKFYPLTKATGR